MLSSEGSSGESGLMGNCSFKGKVHLMSPSQDPPRFHFPRRYSSGTNALPKPSPSNQDLDLEMVKEVLLPAPPPWGWGTEGGVVQVPVGSRAEENLSGMLGQEDRSHCSPMQSRARKRCSQKGQGSPLGGHMHSTQMTFKIELILLPL